MVLPGGLFRKTLSLPIILTIFEFLGNKKFFKYSRDLGIYFSASLIPMLLSLVINPLIAKNMSPKDYAISGYFLSFSSLISPIIVFYLIHYYIKEYFKCDNEARKYLVSIIAKALICFSGIVSLICFFSFVIYFKYFNKISFPIHPYLGLMIFSLPLTGLLNLKLAMLRMGKQSSTYFRISVSNGLLNILLMVIFIVLLKWGALGKLLAPFLCNALVYIYMIWDFRKYLHIKTKYKDFKKIFVFCFPLAISATLGYFTNGFSTSYLESIGDTNAYGIYIVGNSIGMYLTVFQCAISNTFQPDLYESIIKKQRLRCVKLCVLQIGIVSLCAIIFVLLAPYIISILTANRYTSSIPYAQIISLSTITSSIYYIINNYSIAINRQKLYLVTTIFGSICIIFLMPILVDKWSFYGGAWMVVISYIILSIINLFLLIFIPYKI